MQHKLYHLLFHLPTGRDWTYGCIREYGSVESDTKDRYLRSVGIIDPAFSFRQEIHWDHRSELYCYCFDSNIFEKLPILLAICKVINRRTIYEQVRGTR